MKKILAYIAATVAFSTTAYAADITTLPEGALSDVSVERSASSLLVNFKVYPAVFPKKANREVWLTPAIIAGADTLRLDPVVIAGRTRYFQHLRGGLPGEGITLLRSGSAEAYSYSAAVPYQNWLELSSLTISGEIDGCCGEGLGLIADNMTIDEIDFRERTLEPMIVYVSPTKEIEKFRSSSGSAYIDFPVNQTAIYPDYRRNPAELREIRRTIDDIHNDRDVTITSLSFKGYASPEGPYANNERLAQGRTEALIEYVRSLYQFPADVMHASWEAEDWQGLEKRIAAMEIADKEAILNLVRNKSISPDEKDAQLRKRFPTQYAYLLANVYPALRHSDYEVTYKVRNYTDVSEIAEVMRVSPQKLSLDELFLYAKSLDPQSPEFREVMEVSVRMYPDNAEANLNAASTAVDHGEFEKAGAYLEKAGDSPMASYLKGVMAAKRGDYAEAKALLESASRGGVTEADDLLSKMRSFRFID